MNDLPGNPYAEALGPNWRMLPDAAATMALAYEQRTATLQAMADEGVRWANENPSRVTKAYDKTLNEARAELRARLGQKAKS